ncbi:MAG: purine-binding chemotaxis protein CheW [archaeon]|nr:purine-binding chemotaxis protein CheW [archaeon]
MFQFEQEADSLEYLGFIVNNDYYCINLHKVQEIIYIPAISKIPNVPQYIDGAINLRGKIIRIINLRKWFKFPEKKIDDNSRIIVLKPQDLVYGILVDEIYEVFYLDKEEKFEKTYLLNQQPEISYFDNIIVQDKFLFLELNCEKLRK